MPQLYLGMLYCNLRQTNVKTPHPRSIPEQHPPSIHPFTGPLIKVRLCHNPLGLIYLIRFVLFPQSKPLGTLLPPVIKGSKSREGPVQCLLRESGSCKLFEALVSPCVYPRSHGDCTTVSRASGTWPGVFWLRSKVFHCCVCPELAVTSLSVERAW